MESQPQNPEIRICNPESFHPWEYGPSLEKTCLLVSDQVILKPVCSATDTS